MTCTSTHLEIKKLATTAQKKKSGGCISSGAGNLFFQPKLTVSNPDDVYEKEADAVADRVMRMPSNAKKSSFFSPVVIPVTPLVQPKCAICEEENVIQRQEDEETTVPPSPTNLEMRSDEPNIDWFEMSRPFYSRGAADMAYDPAYRSIQRKCAHCEEEEKEKLQRKEGSNGAAASEAPPIVSEAINSGGESMDDEARSFMENRFGYDFSNVKIHTGAEAAQSAQSIHALAYTSGSNIVFNEGQYAPATDNGKRLLAHELTHVIQQDAGSISRKLLQKKPVQDPVHDALLDQFSEETGIPRDQASQHSEEYRRWLGVQTKALDTTVNIEATCNRKDIIEIVNQALVWLDDVYQQLLEYNADEVFKDVIPPQSSHTRIAGALQQAFNTTDLAYIEVIRRRFLQIAQLLRTNGKITVRCKGQYCSAGGTSFTAAYVSGPYALTMCGVGTPGNRPIATFIHELTHAVLPQVGISNDVTTEERVTDRAYRGDRVFQFLSPEETLDNADSYAVLAQLLHARANTQLVTLHQETTPGCTQPQVVLEAFARADQWNHFALHNLDTDVNFLQGKALNTLPTVNLSMLNKAFPNITTTAELTALRDAFQLLNDRGFGTSGWDLQCTKPSDANCNGNTVAFSGEGKVSISSVTLQKIKSSGTVTLCPDWFGLSHDDRIRTIYAVFLIGRPSWIVTGFQLQDALDYVDGAQSLTEETIPAPATSSAWEHIESDDKSRKSGNKP